jgi:hypothetical protein
MRVTVLSPPRIAPPQPLTLCTGANAHAVLGITSGTKPYRFAWVPPDGLSRPDAADPLIAPARSTIYTVTVTDANGCFSSAQLPVTVLPAPVASAGPDLTLCAGEKKTLRGAGTHADPHLRYSWKPVAGLNDPSSPTPEAAPKATTEYVLTVTSTDGCMARDTMRVAVLPPLAVKAVAAPGVCPGERVQLEAVAHGGSPPYRYAWTPADLLEVTTEARPTSRPLPNGRNTFAYHVNVTDANGCMAEDSARVVVSAAILAVSGPVQDARMGDTITLRCAAKASQCPEALSGRQILLVLSAKKKAIQFLPAGGVTLREEGDEVQAHVRTMYSSGGIGGDPVRALVLADRGTVPIRLTGEIPGGDARVETRDGRIRVLPAKKKR